MTLQEKISKRAGLVVQMRSLLDKAEKANRDLSPDEQTTYNNTEKDVDELGVQINRANKLAATENALRDARDHNFRPSVDGGEAQAKKSRFPDGYRNALFDKNGYARVGKNGLTSEFVNVLNEGTDAEGGYLVPEEFETQMTENLVNADPIRAGATVITTAGDRNIPVEGDQGSFAWIAESGDYGDTSDPAIGRVVLGAHKAGGIIKVAEELLQDSAFALEGYLNRLASRRYNAIEQTGFANGSGTGCPLGLFRTTAVAGVNVGGFQGAAAAAAAIAADDLVDTFHALARAYRDRATWVTSDTMIKMIRKLKTGVSGDKTYLWQPSLIVGQPDSILSRPVAVSDGAPAPAISGKSIVFLDLSAYYIVDRLGISMQRLNELYAAKGQVGFKFTKRTDGKLTNAAAMVYFQHGAAA